MSSSVKVTPTVALYILERQQYRCAMTGRTLTPETAVLDHIIPLSRGGEHAASNIWVLHCDVNRAKGKLLPEEFSEMCEQVLAQRGTSTQLRQRAAAGWTPQETTEVNRES